MFVFLNNIEFEPNHAQTCNILETFYEPHYTILYVLRYFFLNTSFSIWSRVIRRFSTDDYRFGLKMKKKIILF